MLAKYGMIARYNLAEDHGETKNQASQYPYKLATTKHKLSEMLRLKKDTLGHLLGGYWPNELKYLINWLSPYNRSITLKKSSIVICFPFLF